MFLKRGDVKDLNAKREYRKSQTIELILDLAFNIFFANKRIDLKLKPLVRVAVYEEVLFFSFI